MACQVYELGLEQRCQAALRIAAELASTRVRIAACYNLSSYSRLAHRNGSSLAGSAQHAAASLTLLAGGPPTPLRTCACTLSARAIHRARHKLSVKHNV